MPGGPRGPVPKPSAQRRRRNKTEGPAPVKVKTGAPQIRLEPDPKWHPIARAWFESLGESGQAQFYQSSDWQTARYVAEAMSRNLGDGRMFSATLFAAVMAAMTELLTTEGARRRARIEIEREQPSAPASVSLMEEYRRAAKTTRSAT